MANGNTTARIGFEEQIWAAADILRGNMDAAEYKHVVLGLIFLKYISDKFDERYQELKNDDDDVEDRDAYTEKNIFFVPPSARWSVIAEAAHREEIGTVIDDAMRAIEKENKRLKDILPKNFARNELDKRRLGNVVDLFTNIRMVEHGENKDILGSTYQYCLQQFASKEGKRGGEYYTPSCMVRTLVAVLKPSAEHRIYDPCCGSGGMFVQSEQFVKEHSGGRGTISIYGQESNPTTRKLAMMNLAIRGIDANLGAFNADTFSNDLHPQLKADYILANPPFNLSDWNDGSLNDDPRWKYGLPPSGNANFAWLQHMIYHLAPNGKIGMVLANGSLSSQSGGEGEIRRKIVEDDLIEGIIAMPSNLFYGVTIPATLWFVSRNKTQKGKTLFVDARKMGTLIDRIHRELSDEEIQKLADTFEAFDNGTLEDVKGFCAAVTTEEIAKQDFILTPGRYVGIEEQEDDGEPFDEKMTRLTTELSEMFQRSHELEAEIKKDWERLDMTYNYKCVADVIDEIAMGPFGSNIKVDCFVKSGIPVLNGSNLNGYTLTEDSFHYVTPQKAASLNKAVASRGDVIITHRGTLGQIVYIPNDSKYTQYVISQSQFRVRCKKNVILPEFFVYYFHSREGQSRLLSNTSQVGVPSLARPSSTFKKLEIPVPSISKQEAIVDVLTALDARIAENKKINHHLEQMAQAIFKSWFDCYDPSQPFTNAVQVLGGGTPKTGNESYWNGEIPFFTPKDTGSLYVLSTEKRLSETGLSNCNSRLYPENTVFVTARGTVGKLALAGCPMAMNQSCYALVSNGDYGQFYVYHLALTVVEKLKRKANGAVFDAIVTRDFETELVPAPATKEIKAFEDKIQPIFETILNNCKENARLAELRDTLLPRLMSGELSVADIGDGK